MSSWLRFAVWIEWFFRLSEENLMLFEIGVMLEFIYRRHEWFAHIISNCFQQWKRVNKETVDRLRENSPTRMHTKQPRFNQSHMHLSSLVLHVISQWLSLNESPISLRSTCNKLEHKLKASFSNHNIIFSWNSLYAVYDWGSVMDWPSREFPCLHWNGLQHPQSPRQHKRSEWIDGWMNMNGWMNGWVNING